MPTQTTCPTQIPVTPPSTADVVSFPRQQVPNGSTAPATPGDATTALQAEEPCDGRLVNLEVALKHGAAGILTFPAEIVRKDGRWLKKPLISDWQAKATTDAVQIHNWWKQFPHAVAGIELGRSNLVALDADRHGGPDGVAAFNDMVPAHGGLPPHPTTLTPGDGEHHAFAQRNDMRIGNRRGALPAGIDVRGAGGWIVAQSTVRPDGRGWLPAPGTPSLAEAYIAGTIPTLPAWLAAIIRSRPEPPPRDPPPTANGACHSEWPASRETVYARQALGGAARDLRRTPAGGRNEALNGAAYHMGRMVARGWIDQTDVVDELSEAAIASGLDVDEVQKTLASGLTAGMQNPAEDLANRPHFGGKGHAETGEPADAGDGGESAPPSGDTQETDEKGSDTKKQSGRGRTQASVLIEFATGDGVELYHSPDGTAFADLTINGHRETWSTKSAGFRYWLRRAYYEGTRGAPNSDAMSTAMGVIEARAHYDGTERSVHLRVAEHDGKIYIDLCDTAWRAIEVDANGWRVVSMPPVRFRRTAGTLPLPAPVRGGKLDELRKFINVSSDDSREGDDDGRGDDADDAYIMIVSFLLAVLRARGPYPVLGLSGEQGTGKSLLLDLIRRLIDPNVAALRSLPRDVRDLFIAAANSSILCFDNLSSISPELSDALCRVSTGGGFSTRQLYSDDDEYLINVTRPIALNGIVDVASRSDLADRLQAAKLRTIAAGKRKSEREIREAFDAARPRILGALLDVVAGGLRELPNTRMNRLPRMADFALWIRACELGGLWPVETHMSAYDRNRGAAAEMVVEFDPVATALQRHMEGRVETTTTATELLEALTALAAENVRRGPQWPGNGRALSGRLTRLAPALRHVGIKFTASREGNTGRRLIHIRRTT